MTTIAPLDLDRLEADAKKTASKHISNMIQRPDQLEKIDHYRRRYSRKKASVEAMLKTAVQSQLDEVRKGLSQLQTGLSDVKEIKKSLDEVDKAYSDISELNVTLAEIREENSRHSQLAAAVENLKHIFTVPETVKRTEEMINDGKLLHAHKSLMDLEASRDDLLFEVHKQQSPTDKNMVNQYFKDIAPLNEKLSKQLWLILQRTLQTVRKEPTMIVTALRIIEREERTDKVQLRRKEQTGFIPPGRPKHWKKKCMHVLEQSVLNRIQGSQLDYRETDKMWLVKHLELLRQQVVEDIRVAKTLCPAVFPPDDDIGKCYVDMYHRSISTHVCRLIEEGLEGNEIVTMLSWLNTYEGKDMMGHFTLKIDVTELGPLLPQKDISCLENQYLSTMKNNFDEWMNNSLQADKKDWDRDQEPEADGNAYFNTQLPVLLCQMIEQNLQVASHIGFSHLVTRALGVCCEELQKFTKSYLNELRTFKERHLLDRREPRYYVHYMIANVNNCESFINFVLQLKNKFVKEEDDREMERQFSAMQSEFDNLTTQGANYLLEEVMLDLKNHLQELVSRKWLECDDAIETICITMEDYCQDFVHLKPQYFNLVMTTTHNQILTSFIKSLIGPTKKITFKNNEERKHAGDKICVQAEQLEVLFRELAPKTQKGVRYYPAFPKLAEIIRMTDATMLQLELSSLVTDYPDIRREHLVNLLAFRDDVSKSEAQRLAIETITDEHVQKTKNVKTLFHDL